jgi:hypothetical protein
MSEEPYTLSQDQRTVLELYLRLYNETNRQIDLLYVTLDEIRRQIDSIVNINSNRRTQTTNTRNEYVYSNYHQRRQNIPNNRPFQDNVRTNFNNITYENNPTLLNRVINRFVEYYTNNPLRNNEDVNNFYSNVIVRATPLQIERASRTLLFSEIDNPLNNSCPITLEPFEPNTMVTQLNHCGHIFNEESMRLWFQTHVRCPVCRYDIREENVVHDNTTFYQDEEQKEQEPTSQDVSLNTINDPTLNEFSNITQELLNQLFPSNSLFRANNYTYDISANEIIFQGFVRP